MRKNRTLIIWHKFDFSKISDIFQKFPKLKLQNTENIENFEIEIEISNVPDLTEMK
jgi:predicted nuclease of predicted toxin-antitoxin system